MASSSNDFPWKSLGVGQVLLFILSLLAFMDMQNRMEGVSRECGCGSRLENEEGGDVGEREKRSLKESLFNFTADTESNKKELWVHSLSKIQMDELLEKCLDVHEYCTSESDNNRGAPGPPLSF